RLAGESDTAIESLSLAAAIASARGRVEKTGTSQLDASQLQSDLAAAFIERARRDGSRTDYEKAVAAARKALQLRPTLPEARFNIALALEGLERFREARDEWNQYLAADSSSGWANEAREHLRSLPPEAAR